LICKVCGGTIEGNGPGLRVCPTCVRERWQLCEPWVRDVHAKSRARFQLPLQPPATPGGLECNLCMHRCRMGPNEEGYCGIRRGTPQSLRLDGRRRAKVTSYFDPLPTNCVADWVCAGGTGAGYPEYAYEDGPEAGFYNLAVFLESCNFNCLYCQNWSFKGNMALFPWQSVEDLTRVVNRRTSCVCYFGGDPTAQLPYAIRVAERLRDEQRNQILRICWETNGSMRPPWLKRMVALSLASGGCIKVDLKAWHSQVHRALCGVDNRQVLENFARLASCVTQRPDPPLLVASTLLVPGYVDASEVGHLAAFIARLNPEIPYTLLAFAPQFYLRGLPTTSREQAEACLEAARQAGLRRVRLGNRCLIR
jgi:pyruvate formate lyase activating enzyme